MKWLLTRNGVTVRRGDVEPGIVGLNFERFDMNGLGAMLRFHAHRLMRLAISAPFMPVAESFRTARAPTCGCIARVIRVDTGKKQYHLWMQPGDKLLLEESDIARVDVELRISDATAHDVLVRTQASERVETIRGRNADLSVIPARIRGRSDVTLLGVIDGERFIRRWFLDECHAPVHIVLFIDGGHSGGADSRDSSITTTYTPKP